MKIIFEKKKKGDRCTRIAKSKYDVWPCVPMHSEALTKQGWKKHKDLNIDDVILAYDIQTDTLKWTQIRNLHFYKNAKTIKMDKQHFEIVSTPDHKWIAYNRIQGFSKVVDNEKLNNIIQTIQDVDEGKINKKQAEAKCKSFRHYYKKYNGKTREQIIKEGRISKGGIALTKTRNLTRSMALLTAARLDNCYKPLQIETISKYGDNWVEKILNMSVEQIDAFFASAIIYDGHQKTDLLLEKNVGTRKTENTYSLKQKDEMHGDIFELAAFLSGRNVTRGQKNHHGITSFYVRDKRYIPLDVMRFSQDQEQDVWCPETEFGTWVMRQNNRILITGNSAYASGAVVKCRQGKIWKGVSEQITEEELQEIIAEELAEQLDNLEEKDKKPDFKKEKESGLHGWFSRKGGKGGKGWVDCNTCRTDKETGKKSCKSCGRQEGEKRTKYPACRPKPSDCGSSGKGEDWGKKSESVNKSELQKIFEEEKEEDPKEIAQKNIKDAENVVSAATKEKQARSSLKSASSPEMQKAADYEFRAKVETEKLAKKNLDQAKQSAKELSEQTLEEMEPFQKQMHKMHPIWKSRLIGKGDQKAGAAYTQSPDMNRGKSAPPGAGGV